MLIGESTMAQYGCSLTPSYRTFPSAIYSVHQDEGHDSSFAGAGVGPSLIGGISGDAKKIVDGCVVCRPDRFKEWRKAPELRNPDTRAHQFIDSRRQLAVLLKVSFEGVALRFSCRLGEPSSGDIIELGQENSKLIVEGAK